MCDRRSSECGSAYRWTTPLGLPVLQPYFKEERRSSPVNLLPADRTEGAAAPSKQSTALPPNYVHSLDATHMMLTANECHNAGIAFAGVHDSFWTHAADVATCRAALRGQFVRLYQQPLLPRLHQDLARAVDEHAAQAGTSAATTAVSRAEGAAEGAADAVAGQDGVGLRGRSPAANVLTEPPPGGDFDLGAVLQSTYFFN